MKSEEEVKLFIYLLTESIVSRCLDMGIYKIQEIHLSVIDSKLSSFTRQMKLEFPTMLVNEIAGFALQLFRENYSWENPVRGMGVSVSRFVTKNNEQLSLCRDEKLYKKYDDLQHTVEQIRKKYGNLSVRRALIMTDSELCSKDIKGENIIHPEGYF